MKLILGKKKAKGMTSICEVVRRQEELQKRLGFGMLQTLKVVTDYGLPQNRKQFQKEVDQSQEYYNEHFGPKIEDSVDKHTESELYMLELNKGLKEGKQVAMFQHDDEAGSNRILTDTINRKNSIPISRGESPDLSFNHKLSDHPESENQAFKSFEMEKIEKIDDSRFSGQFAPVFEKENEDFNSQQQDQNLVGKEKRVSKVNEENEEMTDSACQTDRTSEGPLIVRGSEMKSKENLSEVIRKAVDLNESKKEGDIGLNEIARDSDLFKREKSEKKDDPTPNLKIKSDFIQNEMESQIQNQKNQELSESGKNKNFSEIEESASFYPTESQGGEVHNVFQSEKGGEKLESKVCANGSEEEIKVKEDDNTNNQSGNNPILASAGSFGNGLRVPNLHEQSNSSVKYEMNRKITFQNQPTPPTQTQHENSLYSNQNQNSKNTSGAISPNQLSFSKDTNPPKTQNTLNQNPSKDQKMKITFEGIENLLPQTHTQMIEVAMKVDEGKAAPRNVRIEVEDNVVINDTMVTEYVDDGTIGKGSFEMASPRERINGPTGKFQSDVLSSINESHKNTLLSK